MLRSVKWCFLLAVIIMGPRASSVCAEEPTDAASSQISSQTPRPRSFRDRSWGGGPSFHGHLSQQQQGWKGFRVREVDSGYLFVEGSYIEPPYALDWHEESLRINGTATSIGAESLPQPHRRAHNPWDRQGNTTPLSGEAAVSETVNRLKAGDLVLLRASAAPVVLNSYNGETEMLRAIVEGGAVEVDDLNELTQPATELDLSQLQTWLTGLETPASLKQRAATELAELDRVVSMNVSQNRAVRRLDQWGYLLTLTGMVLVVASFGHLLSSPPGRSNDGQATAASPHAIRALLYSVGLVVALSVLDLIWTLLSSQAGIIREVNPLARQMIDHPVHLTLFKATITAIALGIMLVLRRYRPAQVGAWWACLICTLLTARWLVLNSLLV